MLKFTNIPDLLKLIDEQVFIKHLEKIIWKGKSPVSPFDPTSKVYKYANGRYRCKNTGKYFNVKTGTIFENSKLPLWKWFYALHLYSNHKKGVSSHYLAREIKTTQTSAWFVLHRLRFVSDIPLFKGILKGIVEIDETFVGGKNKNRHKDKKVPNSQGRSYIDKVPVLGMIERGSGNLIAQVVPNTRQETLEPIIRENVEKGAVVHTDKHHGYNDLYKWYKHGAFNKKKEPQTNRKVSTNCIESAWAPFKRSVYGIYHKVSSKHLPKYVREMVLRHNTRNWDDEERFDLLLASAVGKRLTYESLIHR